MWSLWNLNRFFDIIAPKLKWLSFENSLSVIWRFTPSIPLKYINPNNASISTLPVFFYPCVLAWFIEVITLLQTCYSFIYPSVCTVNNFVHDIIIKVLMESIFDVFNIVCSGVWGKTTYSTLNGIAFLLSISGCWILWAPPNFLCVFVVLWTKINTKFFQNTIFVYIYDSFIIVFI